MRGWKIITDSHDYEELGFRCGIEIHQQLDTSSKLFCECSTEPGEHPDAEVERELRPVPSEMGEVDRAAQFEFLKDKWFRYNVFNGSSCLVELDEEPPHPVDDEAFETALETTLLLNCEVPDEIHFMRKTVIDGSNTAGFQRTAVVGLEGSIETEEGEVGIEGVQLEEDSAGIHSKEKSAGVYDLDRLGVPLLEIGTDASIQSPSHAKEVAEKIGMLLRSTGKVKRGLGTIRQDVNVSIEDGARVEIKGFQELEQMDELVRREVERQKSLVSLAGDLEGSVASGVEEVTDTFEDTDSEIFQRILESEGIVLGFKLSGLEGRMNEDLCEGLHLGKELSSYAEAQGVNGIIHSDEDLERYGLEEEFEELEDELDKEEDEVVCIVAEKEEVTRNAAEAVSKRAERLLDGVPEETRTADGVVTRYARPLPGEARMYPETDIPPIGVDEERIDEVEVPETLEEKEERYTEEVGEELAEQVINAGRTEIFETLMEGTGIAERTAANIATNVLGRLEAEDVPVENLSAGRIAEAADLLSEGDIGKEQMEELLAEAASKPGEAVEELAEQFETAGASEVREAIEEVIEEKQEMVEEQGEHAKGALMGLVMERVENAEGSTVAEILEEELKERLE
ncbi:MAG: Glu-tRNA(Gln) amidotransferase subunit GatE [Candidatus Nanohaloarchaeota archaeon QJJ-7]|nr:Glu-tRNA(Gln) amidotransferase subunit GatE [Candidatus Nanohaloarchaeota archaeon QJJ-7]